MFIPLTNKSNFYSQKLTGDYLRLYNASVDNLSHGKYSTTVTFGSDIGEEIQSGIDAIFEAIIFGCPELFFVKQGQKDKDKEKGISYSYAGRQVSLEFANKYQQDVSDLWNILDTEINRIVGIVKKIPNKIEQIHRINQYLCARVKTNSSTEGRFGDAYGALILKEARCEGYAKAAKLILDRVGFDSIIAYGRALSGGGQEDHAWNIIEVNGNYYHFDFTWNSGRSQHGIPGQEYMFLDDDTAKIEHFPHHTYPVCADKTKMFWVKNNGIVKYHSDLSRIKIVPFKNNYLGMAKYDSPLSKEDLEENIFKWMRNELAGHNYGSQLSYSINERLNLLIFYFINQ